MAGPSPWRLPSPRGGMTSVTVSGSTIEPVGSIILLPVPGSTILRGLNTSSEDVTPRRHAEPSRKIVGAPTDESHAPGRDRAAPAVGHPRVRAAPRQRAGAGAVRPGRSLVRPPHHRGRAEVPVVTAAPPALPGRRRSRPIGPIYFEPNVTPTRSGRNFVDTSEVWMLA